MWERPYLWAFSQTFSILAERRHLCLHDDFEEGTSPLAGSGLAVTANTIDH